MRTFIYDMYVLVSRNQVKITIYRSTEVGAHFHTNYSGTGTAYRYNQDIPIERFDCTLTYKYPTLLLYASQ